MLPPVVSISSVPAPSSGGGVVVADDGGMFRLAVDGCPVAEPVSDPAEMQTEAEKSDNCVMDMAVLPLNWPIADPVDRRSCDAPEPARVQVQAMPVALLLENEAQPPVRLESGQHVRREQGDSGPAMVGQPLADAVVPKSQSVPLKEVVRPVVALPVHPPEVAVPADPGQRRTDRVHDVAELRLLAAPIAVALPVPQDGGRVAFLPDVSGLVAVQGLLGDDRQAVEVTQDSARFQQMVIFERPMAAMSGPQGGGLPPDLPRQIAQQMVVAISQQGDRTTEIALSPVELGRVRMQITAHDGAIMLHVLAERPETADLLRRHADTLAQEFRALGFHDIAFSFGDGRKPDRAIPAAPRNNPGAEPAPTASVTTEQGMRKPMNGNLDMRM